MFLFLVLSLFMVPNISLAATCQTEECAIKALISYDRAILKANDALFGAVMKIGSKYLVPLTYGAPLSPQAEVDWQIAVNRFVVANQKAAGKLLAALPQEDVIHILTVDFSSASGVDFLTGEAEAAGIWLLQDFFIFP